MVGVVAALFAWMVGVLAIPQGRLLFELAELPVWQYFALFGASLVWMLLCHLVWRSRILDRWLGTVDDPGNLIAKKKAAEAVAAASEAKADAA